MSKIFLKKLKTLEMWSFKRMLQIKWGKRMTKFVIGFREKNKFVAKRKVEIIVLNFRNSD